MAAKKETKKPLEIVLRDTAELKPDPRNARVHPPAQIEKLRASIRKFGFNQPVLLRPNGMIGAGHGRWEAAKLEGLKLIPTITIHLPEKQWRAYAIADNHSTEGASWDNALLGGELQAIQASGVDLEGLGFESLPEAKPDGDDGLSGGGRTGTRISQTVIQFNIVFDDVDQQAKWHTFVRQLKGKYPNAGSLGERLALFLEGVKV